MNTYPLFDFGQALKFVEGASETCTFIDK